MNRALALWRWAGVGLVWDAADPGDAPLRATAETVIVHVHYHLHLAPGQSRGDAMAALAPGRAAIETREEREMGIISRVIKIAGVADDDGEMVGGTVDEQMTRPTMHGRQTQWQLRNAQGNLMRMNDKPKLLPWSKDTRRP